MRDIKEQLDSYQDHLDSLYPAVTVEDIHDLVGTAPVRLEEPVGWHPAVVLAAAALVVLIIGAPLLVFGVFSSNPVADEPGPTTPDTVPVTIAISEASGNLFTNLRPVKQAPSMSVLADVWQSSDGGLLARGDSGIWATSDGDTWEKVAAPTDAHRIVAFGDGFAGVTWGAEGSGLRVTLDGQDWMSPELPEDVVAGHPAITLHYSAEDVAAGTRGLVVQGYATSSVNPAAIEAAYPELGPIVDVSPIAPCGPDGGPVPVPCELDDDDALWVRTADAAEYQAVSLTGLGLTKADILRAYRVMWFSEDGRTFEMVSHRVISERGYGPDPAGIVATDNGFLMVDGALWVSPDGALWVSPDGRQWEPNPAPPYEITNLVARGSRVYGYTTLDQTVEYHPDGSWSLRADPSLAGPELDHRDIETITDRASVVIGYEDVLFPEIAGDEPLSTARVIGVWADGAWTLVSLGDVFGSSGAIEVELVGDHLVIAFGGGQPEDLEEILQPDWWIATIND
jgi:hypothetical protein